MSSAEIIQLNPSPLDRMITVTVFNDRFAYAKRESVMRARRLPSAMDKREAPTKHALPLLKLASFGDAVTARGSYRTNANTLSIDGIEGDYDGGQVSVEEAVERLRAANLAGIVYTSPSHTAEKPRWRVLAFTSTTLPPEARGGLVARLNGALGGILHPESFTLSQPFYFGRVEGAAYRCELVEGRAIDQAPELPALGPAGKPHRQHAPAGPPQAPLDNVIAALAIIPNAERNWIRWVNVGMAIWRATAGSEEGRDAFHAWSEKYEGYDAAYTDDRWEHFSSSPPQWIGFPALERAAREVDPRWRPPSFERAVDQTFKPAGTLRFVHYDDIVPGAGGGYLVKRLIGAGTMAVVYGDSTVGKTWFALDLGLSIAAGRTFFGRRVRSAAVVYIAAEGGRSIENRIAAAKREKFPASGLPFHDMTTPINLCHSDADLKRLIAEIPKPAGFIVIDTLSRVLAGGNENGPEDMGSLVMNIDKLRAATGATVLLVHHTGKDQSKGARGHSLLRAATDTEIELTKDETITTARVEKQRDFATEGVLSFTLREIDLGITDDDGDRVTSCVIEEAAAPVRDSLPPSQRAALDALRLLIADNGVVSEETWRETCIAGRVVSAADSRTSRRDAFGRAYRELVRARIVWVYNDGARVQLHQDNDWGFEPIDMPTDTTDPDKSALSASGQCATNADRHDSSL